MTYRNILLFVAVTLIASLHLGAANLVDINFTRDSTYWNTHFTNLDWNKQKTDYYVGGVDGLNVDGYTFKGSYGKFNPGSGVHAQPFDSEDHCTQFIYAFRLSNSGDSYIELPNVKNAGQLTIHCKSGNPTESAVFYIEKYEKKKWVRLHTLVAPPHVNNEYDVVLRKDLQLKKASKLRIYGASKNLHVYSIQLESYSVATTEDKPIRVVVLPDTQTYTQEYPYIFNHQTAWAVNNADNISFLIQVGDITNANNAKQWPVVANAMSVLDNVVPHTFSPGNHDIGNHGSSNTRDTKLLNQYMPLSTYSKLVGFGGAFETDRMDNNWFTFTAEGYQFLVLALEFAPRDAVLEWAGQVVKSHPNHNVIIGTHAYMYSDDQRISDKYDHKWTPTKYDLSKDSIVVDGKKVPAGANDGEQIWDKLVKLYPNILMVVSGHVLNDGTGLLVSEGVNGNKVYQMMANYQKGVVNTESGGNGFLRMIDIYPTKKIMSVRTYSPFINKYKTAKDQQFTFENVTLVPSKATRKKK
ncbi:hypothetical protein MASR2M117_20980 [Paludibacter sp.]